MPANNPLSIEVLEVLDAIERRGSFAKAAEELNRATSAVSYAIQKLEEQLDITVFQRQGRRSVLTPAGRLLLDEGRLLLDAAEHLAERAREVDTGWETRLRIGVDSLFSYPAFFATLERFLRAHPRIEIDVSECILNGGWEALEQQSIDLLVAAPDPVPKHKGFRVATLGEDDLVAVIAASHPAAALIGNPKALQAALPDVRRVVTHDSSKEGITRNAGFAGNNYPLYVENMDQKVAAVIAGVGISHVPEARIARELSEGTLLPLPRAEAKRSKRHLVWHLSNKGKGLRALCDMLLEDASASSTAC